MPGPRHASRSGRLLVLYRAGLDVDAPGPLGDKREHLASLEEVGEAWRAVMGRGYPVMAAIEVAGFIEDGAKLEIEATAVVPEG